MNSSGLSLTRKSSRDFIPLGHVGGVASRESTKASKVPERARKKCMQSSFECFFSVGKPLRNRKGKEWGERARYSAQENHFPRETPRHANVVQETLGTHFFSPAK